MSTANAPILTDPHRLSALRRLNILDTPQDRAFDGLAALARNICDTPAALISLIDDKRQWFKARSGFDIQETPLSQSICALALVQGSLLIIPDLAEDPRTRENPLVTEPPRLRFYAGALLRSSSGVLFGTLCVVDDKPRPHGLTGEQAILLQTLADQAVELMELRRAAHVREDVLAGEIEAHRQSSDVAARLQASQEAGRVGTFEVDLTTDRVRISPEVCRIFGLAEAEEMPVAQFEALVVPEDRELQSHRGDRAAGTSDRQTEYRILRASDGALRWIARRGEFLTDGSGRLVRFAGTVSDITDRKMADQRQAELIRLADIFRDAGTVETVGMAASEAIGRTLTCSRVGFAQVDRDGDSLAVEFSWVAEGAREFSGRYPLSYFPVTLERLRRNEPFALSNLFATSWMEPDFTAYEILDTRAAVLVPLHSMDELVGILFVHSAVARTWSQSEIDFIAAVAERAYVAMARLRNEAQQSLLNGELSHRLKNTLAMVQAIASQTLRGHADIEALSAFSSRLRALSRAHEVLLQQSWSSARIEDTMQAVLGSSADVARYQLNGPNIRLGPNGVLSLSMLLHELSTNAVKHGSLSVAGGIVAVEWSVERIQHQPTVLLHWRELGGPSPQPPTRKGFGSRLIELGLAGTADVTVAYDSTGFTASFQAPLALLEQN